MSELGATLLSQARELLPRAVELRREIHRHPELGNELPRTRTAVLESIADLGLEVQLSETTSGIVATLQGAAPGPAIVLRGDMDALPMPEDTGLEYASRVDGRMHACGYDCHTAMLATAARLLASHRDKLAGSVKFMFQPREEGPGGAQPMIDEGLLDVGSRPGAAFALHIYPNLPCGVVACRAGPVLASADAVSIRVLGKGGHGSMPHDANDPIPVACELVQAFQTFVTRRFTPFDPVVLTVGQINAGTMSSVIPEHAELEATLRTFSDETRSRAHDGIRRMAESIAGAHDMTAEVAIDSGYPATYNDSEFVGLIETTTRDLLGDDAYLPMAQPIMAAEDFSLVLHRMPGAMAFLGAAPEGVDPASAAPCHSNRMTLNEDAMVHGVALHAAVTYRYLRQNARQR